MNIVSAITIIILDILFPKSCVGCGVDGAWMCSRCLQKTTILKHSFCPCCTIPMADGKPCNLCRNKGSVDQLVVCARFEQGVIREAIHTLKYNHLYDISRIASMIMIEKLRHTTIVAEYFTVIPVPLHKKRLIKRGFNQSALLAKNIARVYGAPYVGNSLRRSVATKPQADLRKEDRSSNIRNAFVWAGSPIDGKLILLIDDVSTTGATLQECARVLKKAGASKVVAMVLAHG